MLHRNRMAMAYVPLCEAHSSSGNMTYARPASAVFLHVMSTMRQWMSAESGRMAKTANPCSPFLLPVARAAGSNGPPDVRCRANIFYLPAMTSDSILPMTSTTFSLLPFGALSDFGT
jgi:hypothetical protein